jgi:hypothetical protein
MDWGWPQVAKDYDGYLVKHLLKVGIEQDVVTKELEAVGAVDSGFS